METLWLQNNKRMVSKSAVNEKVFPTELQLNSAYFEENLDSTWYNLD